MKLKAYHSILIFAILVMSAAFSSVSNYRKAQYAIVQDMNKALALTLQEININGLRLIPSRATAHISASTC